MTDRNWDADWSDPLFAGVEHATRLAEDFARRLEQPRRGSVDPASLQLEQAAEQASDRALAAIAEAFDAYSALASGFGSSSHDDASPELQVDWNGPDPDPAQIWLHNTTSVASPPLRLHATPFCDHRGRQLDLKVETLPSGQLVIGAGESLEVTVTLLGDRPNDGGTFHGVLLADGLPGSAISVRIEAR